MSDRTAHHGSTLYVGPSGVGKTRATATALDEWIAAHGAVGVVVLDFAPEVVQADGTIFGGRLTRFTKPPDKGWSGVLNAHAPRASASTPVEALRFARTNAENTQRLFDAAPSPTALFANDVTIPFQHPTYPPTPLLELIESARYAVVNAFESTELGREDAISRTEQETLQRLRGAVDHVHRLE